MSDQEKGRKYVIHETEKKWLFIYVGFPTSHRIQKSADNGLKTLNQHFKNSW